MCRLTTKGGPLMYDLIGDIHGHADELVQLLEALGYEKARGCVSATPTAR